RRRAACPGRGGGRSSDGLRGSPIGRQPHLRGHKRSTPQRGSGDTVGAKGGFGTMIERPTGPSRDADSRPAGASGEQGIDLARRVQLLSTEHWSLLATRSMSWNEAFSRTSMFLSTLSAATVALALAGPAMSFGSAFPLFALVVLSVTLFLGLATYVRLEQVN